MIRIELTDAEAARFRELCEGELSDLRMEIANTDSMDFRDQLKRDAGLLKSVIAQLDTARAA